MYCKILPGMRFLKFILISTTTTYLLSQTRKTREMTYKPTFGHWCWLASGFLLHFIVTYGYFVFVPHFILFWGLFISEQQTREP